MSKLDRLADKWIAEGHFSSYEEVAVEVEQAVEQRLAVAAMARQLEADIRTSIDEMNAGGGTVFADDAAYLEAIRKAAMERMKA